MEDELTAQDITKIGIDDLGRLIVYPKLSAGQDYAFIYRAGMEVNWDPQSKCLFTPVPREWSLAQWFAQIFRAMKSEYGVRLVVSDDTKWEKLSPNDQNAMEMYLRSDDATGKTR
jgi:Integron Cassette Protein Hfx_Cass5